MQFESFKRQQPRINISALIDVVFILLIFVVLAANFDRIREMNVALPTAEQATEASSDALVLMVPRDGPMLLDDNAVDAGMLAEMLREKSDYYDVLVLVGDGDIPLERTVRIFDQAAAAGFESVSVATRQESQ